MPQICIRLHEGGRGAGEVERQGGKELIDIWFFPPLLPLLPLLIRTVLGGRGVFLPSPPAPLFLNKAVGLSKRKIRPEITVDPA